MNAYVCTPVCLVVCAFLFGAALPAYYIVQVASARSSLRFGKWRPQ